MNDEDIKVLEWVITNQLYIDTHNECDYHNIYQAIENLIKGYKELEEELEQRIEQKVEDYRYVDKEMIPKSKVREKIKELQEEYIQLFELERKDGERETDCKIVIGEMEILEKLLQEGDDK
jgi:hypothetical protein